MSITKLYKNEINKICKYFQLIINGNENENENEEIIKISFFLAECFKIFHDEIELYLLELYDNNINNNYYKKEQQQNKNNNNNINKEINYYSLTYNNKNLYYKITQNDINELENIIRQPFNLIKKNDNISLEFDEIIRTKWKMYHSYDKYLLATKHLHLKQNKSQDFNDIYISNVNNKNINSFNNNIIFDIPLNNLTNIGLNEIKIIFKNLIKD